MHGRPITTRACARRVVEPFAPAPVDPASAAAAGWRTFTRHYPSMLAAWAPVALVQGVASLALVAYVAATGFPLEEFRLGGPQPPRDAMMRFLGVALPLLFVSSAASLVGWGLVARAVRRRLLPEAPEARLQWAALVALAAALTLLYAAGLLLVLVGFLVLLHLYAFAPAAQVDRRLGPGEALEASRRFARDRRTHGFTALLVLAGLGLIVASSLLASVLEGAAGAAGLDRVWAGAITGPVASWLVMPLLPALPAAYWCLAQRLPQEGAETAAPASSASGMPQAAASAGAARPAERMRSTKCPQCGTLVPYTPTGRPVDVVCPTCGRAGRVL